MSKFIKIRLSIMMLLQFFSLGAIAPIISLYLKDYLHFSGTQIGMILSMSAISAFISPIAGAFIADRVINSERLLAFCYLTASILMSLLVFQTQFIAFILLYFIYSLIMAPVLALSNAITFHHTPNATRNYGRIRVWGTIGWILAAWTLGLIWMILQINRIPVSRLPLALWLSAFASLVLGIYAFTLPLSHNKNEIRKRIIPVESFNVLRSPRILLLSLITFLVAIVDRYYYLGTAPFLLQSGFNEATILPAMSLGQIPEVVMIGLIGFFLVRFGFKPILLLGIFFEFLRFIIFAYCHMTILIYLGLILHGFTYSFFYVSIFIYLDNHCNKKARTGVHQFFSIVSSGFGNIIGNMVAGWSMDTISITNSDRISYQSYWLMPMLISTVIFFMIMIFFKDQKDSVVKSADLKVQVE